MSELLSLLENPLMQLLLIVGAGMGLLWVSEREETRRVARGLPRRAVKSRLLEGLGLAPAALSAPPQTEDVWVTAARELELPIDKVLQLKERVSAARETPARKPPKKQAGL